MSFSIEAAPSPNQAPLPAHAAQLAPIAPAAQLGAVNFGIGAWQAEFGLLVRTESGRDYEIDQNNLSPAQKAEFADIMFRLCDNCPSFEINLTSLISSNGNDSSFHSSETHDIQRLRELVRVALGVEALIWDTYLADQRGCQSGNQIFVCKGSLLTDLKIERPDLLKALSAPKLAIKDALLEHEDKKEILKRYKAGSELTARTKRMLDELQTGLESHPPADALLLDSQKTSLAKTAERFTYKTTEQLKKDKIDPDQHNSTSIKNGAILLEALYPLDLNGLTDEKKKEVLQRKEETVEAVLKARPECRDDKNDIPYVPLYRSSTSKYDPEIKAFAKDVSLAGIDDRKDFRLYGNGSGTGAELFFIKLQSLIAADAVDEPAHVQKIEDCINGSYFQAAFSTLHPHLRAQMKAMMLDTALKLRDVNLAVDVDETENNDELCANFDAAYQAQLDVQFPPRAP